MVSPEDIYVFLEDVKDPEVPVLSIIDLGIVRKVEQVDTTWKITITPTYSGCPAMQVIEEEIKIMTKVSLPSRKLKIKISKELLIELEKMKVKFSLN